MSESAELAQLVLTVLALGSAGGLAFTVAKVRGLKEAIDLTARRADLMEKEVSKLTGQVEALTGELADKIVAAVVAEFDHRLIIDLRKDDPK